MIVKRGEAEPLIGDTKSPGTRSATHTGAGGTSDADSHPSAGLHPRTRRRTAAALAALMVASIGLTTIVWHRGMIAVLPGGGGRGLTGWGGWWQQQEDDTVGFGSGLGTLTSAGRVIVTQAQPHILFVLVDDMGMNDVGYSSIDLRGVTPYIDKLAAGGIKLARYYTMHICTPARSAFLTGKYPSNIGMQFENIQVHVCVRVVVYALACGALLARSQRSVHVNAHMPSKPAPQPDSPWGLPLSETTIVEVFRERGYVTHGVGKWNQGHWSQVFV